MLVEQPAYSLRASRRFAVFVSLVIINCSMCVHTCMNRPAPGIRRAMHAQWLGSYMRSTSGMRTKREGPGGTQEPCIELDGGTSTCGRPKQKKNLHPMLKLATPGALSLSKYSKTALQVYRQLDTFTSDPAPPRLSIRNTTQQLKAAARRVATAPKALAGAPLISDEPLPAPAPPVSAQFG